MRIIIGLIVFIALWALFALGYRVTPCGREPPGPADHLGAVPAPAGEQQHPRGPRHDHFGPGRPAAPERPRCPGAPR